ncbi:NAD(P)-binding domain-containing protein [Trinickia dinghuensis]|uniref:Pyrroline-5-carboxylate reductase n=1 Tax=Trinickia dinghuensis TaxID=2291023 RepID=A0A3D8K518_9BURK|nr:NAD(P)-binding domain-containing protein [Trinickia dinghuensis]RDV00310.1 pyrroline-5-carboxylate reductase [Trinickia dinghuensis]
MLKLGVLGVGDLTEKMVRGLYRHGSELHVLLSPRNHERGGMLSRDLACVMMETNQAVADEADVIIIGVRPTHLLDLAQEVKLRPDQPLISVVMGVSLAELQKLFGTRDCCRAMLSAASEINHSTVVFFPAESIAAQLLAPLGNVIPLVTEREFELATVAACMNGWFYFLADELQQWFVQQGLSAQRAKDLTLSSVEDCVAYSRYKMSATPRQIGESIAIPGTFTAEGLEVLHRLGANVAWRAASDHVFRLLMSKQG